MGWYRPLIVNSAARSGARLWLELVTKATRIGVELTEVKYAKRTLRIEGELFVLHDGQWQDQDKNKLRRGQN